ELANQSDWDSEPESEYQDQGPDRARSEQLRSTDPGPVQVPIRAQSEQIRHGTHV
ncbi:hypothetical protein BVRB_032000, partial [Beta vulgaris subsp. vulgaris]